MELIYRSSLFIPLVIEASPHEKAWVNLPQMEVNTSCGSTGDYSSKGSQLLMRTQ